jgi:CheY-like chemotaxis protein
MAIEPGVIVLVDDDPDFLRINQRVLEKGGYRVACFSDPRKALEYMSGNKPMLVITDLMMERLDAGFSFSRQIKQDARLGDVPVIIVTAIGRERGFDFRPRTPEELEAISADAYLDKPVAPEQLLAKVRELAG